MALWPSFQLAKGFFHSYSMIWFHEYPIIVLWLSHDYPYWTTWKTITSPAITVPSCWWSHSPALDSASITAAPFHGHNALVRLAGSMLMLGSFIWESMGKPISLNDNGLFYMGELWHFHMVENIFLIIQQSLDIPGPCGMRFMTPVAVDPFGVHRGNMILLGILGYNDKW